MRVALPYAAAVGCVAAEGSGSGCDGSCGCVAHPLEGRRRSRCPVPPGSRETALLVPFLLALIASGCMVGPDYVRPDAPLSPGWIERGDLQVAAAAPPTEWWRVLQDPTLDRLVDLAYAQNLPLQAAALRVIEAQALRGIAIGRFFPQVQEIDASYTRTDTSENSFGGGGEFNTYDARFDAAWELDLWGKYRRGIEAADEELLASVASYDDVLVSLIAEVAATYLRIRVLEEQLELARGNASIQIDSLEVATARFEAGGTSDLDVQQATTLLEDTEADIPQFEIDLRQAKNALSVLLGMPPTDLEDLLGRSLGIPEPPPAVLVSIPSELIRRRPDVRRDERLLAAQSARIGIAKSELFPRISLQGSVGLSSEQAAQFFQGRSFEAMGGPRFDWPVLNYGRLINAVRAEDARFQAQVAIWQNTVLVAQREVENAIVGYLRGLERVARLERSVAAANRAVDISLIQYRGGATDYTSVLTAQQQKIFEDRRLTASRGEVTLSVIALYKALGGGWEIRTGAPPVPAATRAEMRGRTWWGDMLEPDEEQADIDAAQDDPGVTPAGEGEPTEVESAPADAGAQRWFWWWPQW
jgi:NodT family efflux transporter outer membrane factor (OMF) lipoprotein